MSVSHMIKCVFKVSSWAVRVIARGVVMISFVVQKVFSFSFLEILARSKTSKPSLDHLDFCFATSSKS